MNKSELQDQLAERAGITKTDAKRVIDEIFGTEDGILTEALKSGEKISITGFGTFETRERAARTGRNPRTGKEIQIAASKAPAFRAGKGLKDSLG